MHASLNLPSLAVLGLEPWMIAFVVPVAALIFAGVIAVSAMYFQHRRRELWHQTARIALEKGQPLPSDPDNPNPINPATGQPVPRWRGLLIGGVVNLGVGLGLFVALSQIPNVRFNLGYFGAIPGFIGLGLLVAAFVDYYADKK